jgi:hypothetical protein
VYEKEGVWLVLVNGGGPVTFFFFLSRNSLSYCLRVHRRNLVCRDNHPSHSRDVLGATFIWYLELYIDVEGTWVTFDGRLRRRRLTRG